MSFATETQLGPYKVIALIGSGGISEVYGARDTRLLRDVALKVLPASFTNDPERLRRFEQEARAVAALSLFSDVPPQFSRDLKSYAYTYQRITSDLYIVDGLK